MNTIFVHRNGQTEQATSIDRAWLDPASGVVVWVDLAAPSALEALILSDTFQFHPLSVEDAMAAVQYPKVEAYDGYLYIVLHGIDFQESDHCFATQRRRLLPRPDLSRHRARRPRGVDQRAARVRDPQPEDDGRRPGRACSTASSTRWSITTGPRSTSSRRGSTSSRTEIFDAPDPAAGPAHPGREAGGRAPAPDRHAGARRHRPARAPRFPRHQHRDVVPVPRHLRPPGARRRRRA